MGHGKPGGAVACNPILIVVLATCQPREGPKGVARVYFFTEALAEFQHVNCMIVRIWEVQCLQARLTSFSINLL